jgi:hypothetical protein
MNKTQISTLVVLAGIVAASSVLALGTMTQTAVAQASCSSGASTDLGSSSTASGADFFDGECGSASSAGQDTEARADGERVDTEGTR